MNLSAAYYAKGNSTVEIYLYKNNILMFSLQVLSLLLIFLFFSAQFKIEKTNKQKSDFYKLCCYSCRTEETHNN